MPSPDRVAIARTVERVVLTWRAPRLAARVRWPLAIGLSGPLLAYAVIGAIPLASVLFDSGSQTGLFMAFGIGGMVAGLGAGMGALALPHVRRTHSLEISSAGVSLDGELLDLDGEVRIDFVLHERGGLAAIARERLAELAEQARQAGRQIDPPKRYRCGVDVVVQGRVVPIARRIRPAQALALADALQQNLPARVLPDPVEDTDREALDRLRATLSEPVR